MVNPQNPAKPGKAKYASKVVVRDYQIAPITLPKVTAVRAKAGMQQAVSILPDGDKTKGPLTGC